ncbi:hypothetical protein B0H12DRAFT_1291891 [Mycena haematopus]|nr:hypothetical protein B0H12DRAFT_1291891 [Mycena haematopus]
MGRSPRAAQDVEFSACTSRLNSEDLKLPQNSRLPSHSRVRFKARDFKLLPRRQDLKAPQVKFKPSEAQSQQATSSLSKLQASYLETQASGAPQDRLKTASRPPQDRLKTASRQTSTFKTLSFKMLQNSLTARFQFYASSLSSRSQWDIAQDADSRPSRDLETALSFQDASSLQVMLQDFWLKCARLETPQDIKVTSRRES